MTNKIINYTAFLAMLLLFININAQNTASTSGNWNNCSTWGNPPAILQNATDTKTINSGTTVTQNTVWSTGAIQLNGDGGVNFANSGNAVIFGVDNGADQSCQCPTPNSLAVSGAGNIGTCSNRTFVLTGNNISNASWTISPTTGVSATSGSGSTATINFNGNASGNYTITFTANNTGGSCTTTTATQSATVNVNSSDTFFTASGSSSNSIQTNATHAGISTCNVTVGSGGFTYNVTGSYTVSGTINISSAGGPNHEVRHNRVGVLATNVGNTPFSFTLNRNAGDTDNYFWMYTAAGGNVSFTISDGKIHKN